MNQVEFLLTTLAPSKIEFERLGDLCVIKTGQPIDKIEIAAKPGPYPVINSGREPLGFLDRFNTRNDPIGITSRGAGVGSVTWAEGDYFRGNLNYSATIRNSDQLQIRFLYHWLLQRQPEIKELATFDGIPALNKSNLEKLRVSVPPLEVQREIVRILDNFMELGAELEAELEARRRQYAHYRLQFLHFEESEAEWVPLSAVGTWYGGGTPSKSVAEFWTNGTIPWLSPKDMTSDTVTSTQLHVSESATRRGAIKVVPKHCVALVVRSNILRRRMPTAYVPISVTLNQDMRAVVPRDGINPKYLAFVIHANADRILAEAGRTDGSMAAIESSKLRDFRVQIPDLTTQDRVVHALDNFDALVNDLTVGLPAELAARRKQYEYYRDKLLTFEEAL